MRLIDSHCHLDYPDFKDDFDAVIARAEAAGVGIMQTICTRMAEFENIYAIADKFPNIYCSVGVHPHHAGEGKMVEVDEIIAAANKSKTIGIGETGLDYYYEHSPRDAQRESFRRHIKAAQIAGLPLIVHTRDADDDTIAILAEGMAEKHFSGLIHCFSGSADFADKCVAMGFYISLSGIITFRKAQALRDAAAIVPMERLLVETDAPYLAPEPHRGKRNEPSYVLRVAEVLADIKNITAAECATATTDNFFRLFTKVKK